MTGTIPNLKLLAYETGVHIGDGNMYVNKNMYRITYSGNLKTERDYYKIILCKIIKKLYNISPNYYIRKYDNSVLLVLNSKPIVKFKREVLGLPIGNKSKIRIPRLFMNNRKLLASCISGIGDTDFSLSFKKNRKGIHKEPRIELFISSETLFKDIKKALKKLEFTFGKEEGERNNYKEFRIRIYGKKNLHNWIKNIGFKNPKNLIKIKFWKKFGYVPLTNNFYYLQRRALL